MKPKPPPPRDPSIPRELTRLWAIHEYKRIVKILGANIKEEDHSLLVDYAQTTADVVELRAEVEAQGHTLESDKGNSYINPTTNLLISRQSHLAALRRDLYFTPKSRVDRLTKTSRAADALLDEI